MPWKLFINSRLVLNSRQLLHKHLNTHFSTKFGLSEHFYVVDQSYEDRYGAEHSPQFSPVAVVLGPEGNGID